MVHMHSGKVEKILKGSLDSIPSPSPLVKIQIMGGKIRLRYKGKSLLGVVNKLFVSRPKFEFSLKVKVMGWNPGNLVKSFLLSHNCLGFPKVFLIFFQSINSFIANFGNFPYVLALHIKRYLFNVKPLCIPYFLI